ncbi:hypothetical protein DSM104299_01687 [Baekduia alba]|uniref:ATP-binding protein n=1 Tax=Baekduia alba TaxID=2997333 RepID=UPI00233FD1F1|nr:LuxR family transcriptional regulator [Baekduia alba]WCB92986.1 hypothetical protein DSM104299_01687 [Baekduia alba]
MLPASPLPALVGRRGEAEVVFGLLDGVRERGAALVLRGEPGIGKSALLTAAAERAVARRLQVLTTAGARAEASLPLAALHRLLSPILALADELPEPQRDALRSAFGALDGAPDTFPVALAALNLLDRATDDRPLLLVADDAQWLDQPSADVLAFLARRLESESIILLLARRDGERGPFADVELPELRLTGLDAPDAAALIDAQAAPLSPGVRRRLLDEAGGNPLALVELPRAWVASGSDRLLDAWVPITDRLERAFVARLDELPPTTRTLMVVAALNAGGSLAETLAATSLLVGAPVTVADLAPAIAAGLIDADAERMPFRHHLMDSAIRHAVDVGERTGAHRALADSLADDEPRRLWHRASALVGPDDALAAGLEDASSALVARGAFDLALTALERAAAASSAPADRGRRLIRAVELAAEIGRFDAAARLLDEADALTLAPLERARAAWQRHLLTDRLMATLPQVRVAVGLADEMAAAGEPDMALGVLTSIALGGWWTNPAPECSALVVAAIERLPIPPDDPRVLSSLVTIAPRARGAAVVERLRRLTPETFEDPNDLRLLGIAAAVAGCDREAFRFFDAAVRGLRAQGRLGLLAEALAAQAWCAWHVGRWDAMVACAEEADRLASETRRVGLAASTRIPPAMLAAMRGDVATAERVADAIEQEHLPLGAASALAFVQLTRGLAALADGRRADAFAQLRRVWDPGDVARHAFTAPGMFTELVDAAAGTDDEPELRRLLVEMEDLTTATRSPRGEDALLYAKALLAADDEAEARFLEALHGDVELLPFTRARLLSHYGAWLRRRRRVADSRGPLRAAREAADAIGAVTWGERARQELRATGETSARRVEDARDRLTPQELEIARMAASGMTNRAIGEQLYLSHRTVASHLYRVFPKLGITNRAQLAGALAVPAEAPAPGPAPTRV